MNPRVKKVTPREDYTLEIVFTNDEVGVYECKPLLEFGVFQELLNKEYFHRVRVSDGTVVWPHGQDICPDTLYIDSTRVRNECVTFHE
jgi:hypothetical protein